MVEDIGRGRVLRLLGMAVLGLLSNASWSDSGKTSPVAESFNYVLGTQTIGAKYQFTEEPLLVETAKAIQEMGSNILKFNLPKQRIASNGFQTLKERLGSNEAVSAVLDMPFAFYFMWVTSTHSGSWRDGFSADDQRAEYNEMYALARHLLSTYDDSGKTFFLGHWEGDWLLLPGLDAKHTPTPAAIQGMIDWLATRQRAVDDAKRDTPHGNVDVFLYTEVNLVQKGIRGEPCLANDVLPHVDIDFVSYSCYDSINLRGGPRASDLHAALDHIESKLRPKAGLAGKRVFVGEYGFPLEHTGTPEEQDRLARTVAADAIAWGCPFVLYWQLYCNEVRDGAHRGFWLIDDQEVRQPFYHTLERYFRTGKQFVEEYAAAHQGTAPPAEHFREVALRELCSAQ